MKRIINFFKSVARFCKNLSELFSILKQIQQDLARLQLLNLIQHTPDNTDAILKLGYRYFIELNGNWYMDSIFQDWAELNNVTLPVWFLRK